MSEDLLIFPCNGNALEALDAANSQFRVVGFVEDLPEKIGTLIAGIPVYSRSAFEKFPNAKVLAVNGSPSSFTKRKEVIDGLGLKPERFATLIHPRASVSSMAQIGRNCLIMAGVVITSNAKIGDNVCILPNTVVHHDCEIQSETLIGALVSIAGGVKVGRNCYIGSGTSIINGIQIGDQTMIGLGSNVIRSTENSAVMAGNPANKIEKRRTT